MGFFSIFSNKKDNQADKSQQEERAPRVKLVPLRHIYLDLDHPISFPGLTIANISKSGIGLFQEKISEWPENGTEIKGKLHIQEKSQDVAMTVIHKNSEIVGCQFTETSGNLRSLIDYYFQVELSAMLLSKIDSKYLKKQEDNTVDWFRGSNNCELYVISSNNNILSFNLSFFGNIIDFDHKSTVKYGKISEQLAEGLQYKGAELVNRKSIIPREIGEASIRFLNNIKNLPKEQREFISTKIQQAIPPED